ncbi:Methyl-accepting chemotaxis protein II [Marinomonas spartinae]|uniref:methyl-accepting chemotaxis protein n=1 Tax=Marinomonas spartinae TaxID=1792290 RepID=UPI000809024D|nr:methyl-accepting chemotaxis protein [Marinomonas spartinae]SBS39402.1 Methyl-accepting chemotaxis protein II [Marinomonas spartinae]
MSVFSNIKLSLKFLVLGILACLCIAIPTKFFYEVETGLVEASKQELNGVEPSTRVLFLIKKIQEYRGLTALYLNQSDDNNKALSAKGSEVLIAFKQVGELLNSLYPNSPMLTQLMQAQTEFSELSARVESKTVLPSEAFAQQTDVVSVLMSVILPAIMETSGLSYDPVANSYHLIIATNDNLPALIENMAQLRGQGVAALSKGIINPAQLTRINSLTSLLQSAEQKLLHNLQVSSKSGDNLQVNDLLAKLKGLDTSIRQLLQVVNQEILNQDITTYDPNTFFDESSAIINELYLFGQSSNQVLTSMMLERISSANQTLFTNLSIIGALIVLLLIISIGVIRSLRGSLGAVIEAVDGVSNGNFSVQLNASRKDEFGPINKGLMKMAQSLSKARDERDRIQTEIEARLIETTRIEQALNVTSTNVMLVDIQQKIIYANHSLKEMLINAESELRKVLPNFNANGIVGSHLDIFNQDPSSDSLALEKLSSSQDMQITLGNLFFRVNANPIINSNGERLGSVIEWLDRTSEVEAENEIAEIVEQASKGNFSQRINMSNKIGFMKFISDSLNRLVKTSDDGLKDISRVLMALSQGNLTERITADYDGQFDDLKQYCNQTSENLTKMMGEIRNAAETIRLASTEIAKGNMDLSGRTETQASSLEETSSSMAQITSTVRLNADNATQANILASEASDVALEGGNLISEVVNTMAAINSSSQKISDIIGVIDGIAFQTNILALNAAVEAARAGEQGRGFAVVASEVRTLAQRSANAAKDIKGLISDSVSKIENGNHLVGQSGQTMDRIVDSIKRVNGIMSEIASASDEQAAGVDEINKAIAQMDEMTQQNAALVEESAAAAESMQKQAGLLTNQVSNFVLSKSADSHSASLVTSMPPSPSASLKETLPHTARTPVTKTVSKEASGVSNPMEKKADQKATAQKTAIDKKTSTKPPKQVSDTKVPPKDMSVKPVPSKPAASPVDDDEWEEF